MAGFRGLFVRANDAGTVGTQPVEGRKSLAGLLVPSSVLGARQGILPAPGDPLRVTGTASWQYSVNAGHVVTSRSDSDGAMLFGSDGTTLTEAVAAAPGSGSRYDLIYVRHLDPDQGEGDPSVVVGVVSGTASGTPVKPAVPAGAVVVAEALMAAGATSTQHASVTITQVLGKTVARGGIVPVASQAEQDALVPYVGLGILRTDTGAGLFYYDPPGAAPADWYRPWNQPWGRMAPIVRPAGECGKSNAFNNNGTTAPITFTAGRRYRLFAQVGIYTASAQANFNSRFVVNAVTFGSAFERFQTTNDFYTITLEEEYDASTSLSATATFQMSIDTAATLAIDPGKTTILTVDDVGPA